MAEKPLRIYRWTPFGDRISMGFAPGMQPLNVTGRNPAISSGVIEDVWGHGGEYEWPTAAEALNLVSTDAGDSAAGAGAAAVLLQGLGAGFIPQQELVNLNGLTPVQTNLGWLRVNVFQAEDAGSAADLTGPNTNIGTITAVGDVSGFTMSQIEPTFGRALQAIFSTAAEQTAVVNRFSSAIGRQTAAFAVVGIWVRNEGQQCWNLTRLLDPNSQGDSNPDVAVRFPVVVTEKSDVRVNADAGGPNLDINAGFGGYTYFPGLFEVGD